MRMLNARQVCEAAEAAQSAGYDAFALGCFFDPGLVEAGPSSIFPWPA